MKKISWKRIFITVFIIVGLFSFISIKHLNQLKKITPHQILPPNRSIIKVNIRGMVTFPDGKPVSNANIYLTSARGNGGWGLYSQTTSNSNGEFIFNNVQSYDTTHPDFVPISFGHFYQVIACYPSYGFGCKMFPIIEIIPNLSIQLFKEQQIRGKVINQYNENMENAKVKLESIKITFSKDSYEYYHFGGTPYKDREIPPVITYTDKNGEFLLKGFPRSESVDISVYYDDYFRDSKTRIKPNQYLTFSLYKKYLLSGTVRKSKDNSIFYMSKFIISGGQQNPYPHSQWYRDKFDYQLKEGKYSIYLNTPGYTSDTITIELNRKNPSEYIEIIAREYLGNTQQIINQ